MKPRVIDGSNPLCSAIAAVIEKYIEMVEDVDGADVLDALTYVYAALQSYNHDTHPTKMH